MTEHIKKADVPFKSRPRQISLPDVFEKNKLWGPLEAELFPDDKDSPEDIAQIQAARDEYEAGNYTTFGQYAAQRANRPV